MFAAVAPLALLFAAARAQEPASQRPGKNIVELVEATPKFSTLVTALKATNLTGTLSGPGPFTLFAPTNEAFAALPTGVLANLLRGGGEIGGEHAQLAGLLAFHVVQGSYSQKDLAQICQSATGNRPATLKTTEGQSLVIDCSGGGGACPGPKCYPEILLQCRVGDCPALQPFVEASNGVVSALGHVLLPPGSPAPAPGPPNPGNHHLFFFANDTRSYYAGGSRCGEVDAAPYMPAALFEPRNYLALATYSEATIRLYGKVPDQRGMPGALKQGRCASIGYDKFDGYVKGVEWAPGSLMGPVCAKHCHCSFQGAGGEDLPPCRDRPDDPRAGTFCSLCGPTGFCPGCVGGNVSIELYAQ